MFDYIVSRVKEPSTWAGLGALLTGGSQAFAESGSWEYGLASVLFGIVAAVFR